MIKENCLRLMMCTLLLMFTVTGCGTNNNTVQNKNTDNSVKEDTTEHELTESTEVSVSSSQQEEVIESINKVIDAKSANLYISYVLERGFTNTDSNKTLEMSSDVTYNDKISYIKSTYTTWMGDMGSPNTSECYLDKENSFKYSLVNDKWEKSELYATYDSYDIEAILKLLVNNIPTDIDLEKLNDLSNNEFTVEIQDKSMFQYIIGNISDISLKPLNISLKLNEDTHDLDEVSIELSFTNMVEPPVEDDNIKPAEMDSVYRINIKVNSINKNDGITIPSEILDGAIQIDDFEPMTEAIDADDYSLSNSTENIEIPVDTVPEQSEQGHSHKNTDVPEVIDPSADVNTN